MLARRCNDQLVLAIVVAARLLDVDVLPCVERENGCRGVPVIRRRNRDCIDALVFEDASEVGDCLWRWGLQLRDV